METQAKELTLYTALGFLVRAGQDGAATTRIAQSFSHPEQYHQRSNRVSQIMRTLAGRGFAETAGTEPSPLYRQSPVTRWRVTAAGKARYKALGETGAGRLGRSTVQDRQAARTALAAAAGTRQAALAAAREEMADRIRSGSAAFTRCYRRAKITELRAVPCTLAEIGELFGLGKERVRQIEMGAGKPCACRECVLG